MRPSSEWNEATEEARRTLFEAFEDRQELAEVAVAAFGGPHRFAERLRRTEFGSRCIDPAWSQDEYVIFIFGADARAGDAYSSGLLYAYQAVAPYVASVH